MKTLIAFTIVLTLLSCNKEQKNGPEYLCPDFAVHYYEGSGWTGWLYEINILFPDTMTIFERRFIPVTSEKSAKYIILKSEVDSLFQDLKDVSKIKLRDYGFGPGKPTDLPTTSINYRICNYTDTAGIYVPEENEVPVELYTLLGRVRTLAFKYNKD